MRREEFVNYVVDAYKKNRVHMGFIPKPRIERDYDLGRFYALEDDSFVFVGSPNSSVIPIFAFYVNPSSRKVGVNTAISLVNLLPKKIYRVRCMKGMAFWKRMGMKSVNVQVNPRGKEVYTLEGILPRFSDFSGQ